MRTLALPIAGLIVIAAAGCKPKPEDQVVGTWAGPNNSSVVINKDKTWSTSTQAGPQSFSVKGNWTVSGETVNLKPTDINGKPVATFVADMRKMMKGMGATEAQMKPLDKAAEGQTLTLASDGKTLTMPNPQGGQAVTLTKK